MAGKPQDACSLFRLHPSRRRSGRAIGQVRYLAEGENPAYERRQTPPACSADGAF
jgi:hypothetical protein